MKTVKKKSFGTLSDGRIVELYTLSNDKSLKVDLISYGARLVSWRVPDRDFNLVDIVLGYDDAQTYD